MALSRSSLSLLYLALAPLVAHGAVAGTAAARSDAAVRQPLSLNPQQKINVDAASQQLDYKTNTVVFRQIVVSQGATRVRADHASATGLNFENSRWTFQGNVQIDAPPRGSLHSDQATVEFRDNRIAGVTITGNPAQFEQQRADDLGMEKGHADQIVYDVDQGTVLLTKDAWISDGRNEMSAPSISYSIREQKVLATSSGANQGVHITITPQAAPKPAPPRDDKGPTGPPRASGASGPPPPGRS
jgi:lipopolysaccharide transport protein LptA